MGMYVSARGWLEVDHKQRSAVEAVIASERHELYSGGWSFPAVPFNWSLCVFYGGDIRESSVPWLRQQVEQLAGLPAVDADGDLPIGLFVLADEWGTVTAWEIRNGAVNERDAPELHWFHQA
jgi:hypothetical protein